MKFIKHKKLFVIAIASVGIIAIFILLFVTYLTRNSKAALGPNGLNISASPTSGSFPVNTNQNLTLNLTPVTSTNKISGINLKFTSTGAVNFVDILTPNGLSMQLVKNINPQNAQISYISTNTNSSLPSNLQIQIIFKGISVGSGSLSFVSQSSEAIGTLSSINFDLENLTNTPTYNFTSNSNTPTPTSIQTNPTITPIPTLGGGNNATGRFYIVGSTIVGPDGRKFIPAGANMSGICFWSNPDETVSKAQAAKDWGWNAIRLNNYSTAIGKDCWGKIRGWNDIDAIVNAYTSRKIVVILDAHDTVGQPLLPTEASVTAYFKEAAIKYKNNPYVWFQLSNEPYASASTQDEQDWMNYHKRILAVIRAQGSENIVIGGAISYGNDPTNVNARLGPQIATGQCNVAFDVHPYFSFSDTAKANAYVKAVQDAGLALIYGEFGVPHPPGTRHIPSITYESTLASNENAVRLAYQYGIGMFKWHGTTPSSSPDFSLFIVNGPDKSFDKINSYTNPTNLTISGKMLWDYVHNLPNQGTFTGNLSASNCASVR